MNGNISSGRVSFLGLLAIVFIILKLCNVIEWSWLWVLSPLWVPIVFVLTIVIVFLPIEIIKRRRKK